ncbi:MAG: transcriptional regulator, TetR family [Ilumatobacteraceae bacterium]|nr:transcriptional regulator, TetR family [Ilumatobacteraceae bacterium]
MVRWEPGSRGRLEEAAMALYAERGYENTTVAAIAERAGLTERTFFRHFADKREVLFFGAGALQELLVGAIATAPRSATPMEAAAAALHAAGERFEEGRAHSVQRQRVIDANRELQERELIKLAALAAAIAEALRRRGVKDPAAGLTGEAAIAVFRIAFEQWVAESNRKRLTRLIDDSLAALKTIAGG